MKNMSLRVRITLAVGVIVTLACAALTLHSIHSAKSYYLPYLEDTTPEGKLPPPGSYEVDRVEDTAELTEGFSQEGLLVMGLTIFASLAFTWWTTGLLLRPLERLAGAMKIVDQKNLSEPLPVPKGASEVRQLTEAFNGMLNRLDHSFRVQKRFAADAAHELKTPLAVMKTSLQVLQMEEEPDAEEYREFVADTEESLERLIRTVESLLALAADEGPRKRERVDLKVLAKEAAEGLKSRAREQSVAISVRGGGAEALGDPTLFYRAIYNVAENAVKYNRENGTADICVEREGEWAVVTVSDTGMGVSRENLNSVFDPFFREDPSRSQEIEGSGLGLAIVKQIMTQYGGCVQIESTPGAGTAVTLKFPQ
jgi:two-component system sensor histidine kinase ArlS